MNSIEATLRLRQVIRRQHKALATEENYVFWLRRYMAAVARMPAAPSSEKKLEQFLTDMACRRQVSASTQNQAFNAIVFFYMVSLGFDYREGRGVTRNYHKAVRWFIKAVEAGDTGSMIHVGRMYAAYLLVPTQAVSWFLRAAEAGLAESFIELAALYNDRKSEVYNPTEAHKWFRVVAEYSEGSNSRALLALAHQHLSGAGVPCDLGSAKLWLHRLAQVLPENSPCHREVARMLKKLEGQFL